MASCVEETRTEEENLRCVGPQACVATSGRRLQHWRLQHVSIWVFNESKTTCLHLQFSALFLYLEVFELSLKTAKALRVTLRMVLGHFSLFPLVCLPKLLKITCLVAFIFFITYNTLEYPNLCIGDQLLIRRSKKHSTISVVFNWVADRSRILNQLLFSDRWLTYSATYLFFRQLFSCSFFR